MSPQSRGGAEPRGAIILQERGIIQCRRPRQRNHSVSHHRSLFAPSPILVRRQPRTNAAHAAASPSRRCDHARKSAADAVRIAAEQRPVGSQTLSRPGFAGFAAGSNKRSLRVHSRHVLRPDGSNMGVLSSSRARASQRRERPVSTRPTQRNIWPTKRNGAVIALMAQGYYSTFSDDAGARRPTPDRTQ